MKIKLYTWRELMSMHAPYMDDCSAYGIPKEIYIKLSRRLLTVTGGTEIGYLTRNCYYIPHEYVKEIVK